MKKFIIIIASLLVLVLGTVGMWYGIKVHNARQLAPQKKTATQQKVEPYDPPRVQWQQTGLIPVNLEQIDHSVKDGQGHVLGKAYFVKPELSDDTTVVAKINAYFNTEYQNWLNGKADKLTYYYAGEMNRFLDSINFARGAYGDASMIQSPYVYTIDTCVAYEDKDVISFAQTDFRYFGGPSNASDFGATFSLKTGELLPFTYFADVKADAFRKDFANIVCQSKVVPYLSNRDIAKILGPNVQHDFTYEDDGRQWDLKYNYCYDGVSVCILFNQESYIPSFLMKWNGKTGRNFRASLWTYYSGIRNGDISNRTGIYYAGMFYPEKKSARPVWQNAD